MDEARIAELWVKLSELGYTRLSPWTSLDMSRPLGRECRDILEELRGKSGSFKTVMGVDNYDVAMALAEAGFLGEDEDEDLVSYSLDPDALYVVLPPPDYDGNTVEYLVFESDEDSDKPE